ncbi:hypothetical protein D3C81_1521770 [compost metagenome]
MDMMGIFAIVGLGWRRISLIASKPLIRGICASINTKSIFFLFISSNASCPFVASVISQFQLFRIFANIKLFNSLSSAIRIIGELNFGNSV